MPREKRLRKIYYDYDIIMRRMFMSIIAALVCIAAYAQTYFYECVSVENPETGMKEHTSGTFYLTFTGGGYNFFQSTEDGEEQPNFRKLKEFGQSQIYQRVESYVMSYGMFGPIMGTHVIYLGCDGVFSRSGWSGSMMRYKVSRYEYYTSSLARDVKTTDKDFLEVLISDDYSTVQYISQSRFDHNGWLVTAKRKNSPGNPDAPNQMW